MWQFLPNHAILFTFLFSFLYTCRVFFLFYNIYCPVIIPQQNNLLVYLRLYVFLCSNYMLMNSWTCSIGGLLMVLIMAFSALKSSTINYFLQQTLRNLDIFWLAIGLKPACRTDPGTPYGQVNNFSLSGFGYAVNKSIR